MAYIDFPLPIKGISEGLVPHQETEFSGHALNVRPRDILEKRIRLGQRPALRKAYAQQIGGESNRIVQILSVTSMD